jgi:SAM-dependent methyltransferase
MYRGKRRVLANLIRRSGVTLEGETVLNFGCGNGYFESVWETEGASRADGIDISPEAIDRLSAAFPHRRYLSADLGSEQVDLTMFGSPALITAIDVLYHIVDDERLEQSLHQLTARLLPGAYFLMTEGTRVVDSLPHVRCRSRTWWESMWRRLDLQFVAAAPVFIVQDRAIRGARRLPAAAGWMLGSAQFAIDAAALRLAPTRARTVAWLLRRR